MVDITTFQLIWFVLLSVLMIGYFVLDGFDLGVGILYPFLSKDEKERAAMRLSIGPVWDGNEVWLLTLGGALFAAFPPAYATVFSGFYLAIMVVLFALILRAVSIHFIGDLPSGKGRRFFEGAFFVGSLLPAVLFGVACGNLINTVPLLANGDVAGDFPQRFVQLLGMFPVLCGLLSLSLCVALGACWLGARIGEGPLSARVAQVRPAALRIAIAMFALVGLAYLFAELPNLPQAGELYALPGLPLVLRVAAGVVACLALIVALATSGRGGMRAFVLVAIASACVVVAFAASLFPSLVPAGDPLFAPMAAENAGQTITIVSPFAASELTLKTMFIIACIGVPLVLVYHVIAYRVFSGKIHVELMDEEH